MLLLTPLDVVSKENILPYFTAEGPSQQKQQKTDGDRPDN